MNKTRFVSLKDVLPDHEFPTGISPPGSVDKISIPINDCILVYIDDKYMWAIRTNDFSKIEYKVEGVDLILTYGACKLILCTLSRASKRRIRTQNTKYRIRVNLPTLQIVRIAEIQTDAERVWSIYLEIVSAASSLEDKFDHTKFSKQSLYGTRKDQTTFIHRYI